MKTLFLALIAVPSLVLAQNQIALTDYAESITPKELKENLYVYASDFFQGRETGTIGQKRAIDFLQNFYSTHEIKPAKGTDFYIQPMTLNIKGEEINTENVAAIIEGSEFPEEYIVISAHLDHVGIKDGEIYNGADDDGSGTVALLEIAEAFKMAKMQGNGPKRSLIFLHVTGEEKGLLGSKYYSENPLYSLDNTMANLNVDMIGRTDPKRTDKDPNYIYLIGADRLSQDLHDISEVANKKYTQLKIDYTFNEQDDPNRFYYRSDHYNFAKNNIPVIFYFSGTHEDYHKPGDTPDKINYDLLTKRSKLIFYTAWDLANRSTKIKLNNEK
mgnify:CR=1 FL=1